MWGFAHRPRKLEITDRRSPGRPQRGAVRHALPPWQLIDRQGLMLRDDLADRASRYTSALGDLANRLSIGSRIQHSGDLLIVGRRSAKPLPGPREAGLDALLDHRALELGEHPAHLKHGATAGRGRVEPLLMQVEVNILGTQILEEANQVLERPAQAIDGPCGDDVEVPPRHPVTQRIEARPLSASLGPRYAVVTEGLDDLPLVPLGDRAQLAQLVGDGLPVGADTCVQCNSFAHLPSPSVRL